MTPLRQRMLEDLQIRHLSPHTQRLYLAAVARFAQHFGRSPAHLGAEHLQAYQLHLLAQGTGHAKFTLAVSAVRFLYTLTLQKEWRIDAIPHARKPQRLPVVLRPAEVTRFLAAPPTLKYRTAVTLAYAAGLRVSERAVLKVSDIDSQGMVIRVAPGKGRKDRYVMRSPKVLLLLRPYGKAARPRAWLFPGHVPGEPLNVKSFPRAGVVTRQAAGLPKPVTLHTLRTGSTSYSSFQRLLYCSGSSACPLVVGGGLRPACTA